MADEKRRVEFDISAEKALKKLSQLRDAQVNIAKASLLGDVNSKKAAKSIKILEDSERNLLKTIRKLNPEFEKGTRKVKEQEKAYSALETQLDSIDEQFSRTSQLVGQAGDVGSAGRTIGGAIGAIGGDAGGQIESVISALSELPDTLEAIPRLQDSFKALPKVAQLVTDKLGLGGLTGKIQDMIPALGGAGASVAVLSAPLILLAAVAAAASIVQGQLNEQYEEQAKLVKLTAEAYKNTNKLLSEGASTDEATANFEDLNSQLGEANRNLADAQKNWALYAGSRNPIQGIQDSLNVFGSATEDELAKALQEAQAEVDGLNFQINDLGKSILAGEFAAGDLKVSEEELTKAREAAGKTIDTAISQAAQRATQSFNQISQFTDQISDTYAQRDKAGKRTAENLALEEAIEGRKREEAAQEHQDRLVEIQAEGNQRLEELQAGFAELGAERAKALSEVDDKGNKKLAELQEDYFKSSIDATKDFQKSNEKAQSDSAKRIKKINDDLLASLQDAEASNNVIAFLEAQKKGKEALENEAQSAEDAEKERVQDFIEAQNKQREAFQEKQAEIYAGIEEEKQKVIESYNEKRIALQEQIEAEKVAIAERVEAEKQAEADRLARQAQDDADQKARDELRKKQEEEDFQANIKRIEEQRDAAIKAYEDEQRNIENLKQLKEETNRLELSAIEAISSGTLDLVTVANQLKTAAASIQVGSGSSGSSTKQTGFGISTGTSKFGYKGLGQSLSGGLIQPFHEGGRIEFPGSKKEGLIFAKQDELVIDPKSFGSPGANSDKALPLFNEGRGKGGGAGAANPIQVTVQMNNTIGDIATQSMLNDGLASNLETVLYEVIEPMISNALNGNR